MRLILALAQLGAVVIFVCIYLAVSEIRFRRKIKKVLRWKAMLEKEAERKRMMQTGLLEDEYGNVIVYNPDSRYRYYEDTNLIEDENGNVIVYNPDSRYRFYQVGEERICRG